MPTFASRKPRTATKTSMQLAELIPASNGFEPSFNIHRWSNKPVVWPDIIPPELIEKAAQW